MALSASAFLHLVPLPLAGLKTLVHLPGTIVTPFHSLESHSVHQSKTKTKYNPSLSNKTFPVLAKEKYLASSPSLGLCSPGVLVPARVSLQPLSPRSSVPCSAPGLTTCPPLVLVLYTSEPSHLGWLPSPSQVLLKSYG